MCLELFPVSLRMSRKKWTALDKALSPAVLDVVHGFKFDLMTPVQVSAIDICN